MGVRQAFSRYQHRKRCKAEKGLASRIKLEVSLNSNYMHGSVFHVLLLKDGKPHHELRVVG